ncbi:Exocyst complex component Exo70 [Sesbania bispinosa]|nr:Exocyst complex component Exo70 [Sesbania bispinosa]
MSTRSDTPSYPASSPLPSPPSSSPVVASVPELSVVISDFVEGVREIGAFLDAEEAKDSHRQSGDDKLLISHLGDSSEITVKLTFNAMFEEVHRTQAVWLIPDSQLREELQISISYRSFLGRFKSHIESGRHPKNYIKYSVEDLEDVVLDFF